MKIVFILHLIGCALCLPSQDAHLKAEWRSDGISVPSHSKEYNWGYVISPTRGHAEQRGKDGIVTGVVSFVNAKGDNVHWSYTAHPQFGFKITEYEEIPNGNLPISPPLLKSAHSLGYITADGFEGNQERYIIDDAVVTAAGSESQLADNLGAVPVAAIHDVRGPPPNLDTSEQTGPILITERGSVPDQDSKRYVLLVPARI